MAATANIKAGKAYVEVTAETSRFRKNLAGAQAELRAFGKTCTALGRDMLAFGGALSLPFAMAEKSFAGFDDNGNPLAATAQGQKAGVTIRRDNPKIGRNDPCPCGSGKKYKNCCARNLV